MKRNEQTSARVAKIAAKVLAMKPQPAALWPDYFYLAGGSRVQRKLWRDVRALAASALKTADKPKRKAKVRR